MGMDPEANCRLARHRPASGLGVCLSPEISFLWPVESPLLKLGILYAANHSIPHSLRSYLGSNAEIPGTKQKSGGSQEKAIQNKKTQAEVPALLHLPPWRRPRAARSGAAGSGAAGSGAAGSGAAGSGAARHALGAALGLALLAPLLFPGVLVLGLGGRQLFDHLLVQLHPKCLDPNLGCKWVPFAYDPYRIGRNESRSTTIGRRPRVHRGLRFQILLESPETCGVPLIPFPEKPAFAFLAQQMGAGLVLGNFFWLVVREAKKETK